MKTTFEERSLLSHVIYCRIFWIEDFLNSAVDSPVLNNIVEKYSEEKSILEGILKKMH